MTEKPFSREHIVSPEDRDRMFTGGCRSMKERALFICLAFAGMRVSEVSHANATWWTGQEIKVPQKTPCDCASCHRVWLKKPQSKGFWTPKTRHGARSIPVRAFYRPFLTQFFKASPAGFGVSERTIERWVSDIAVRAGLDIKVFPHAFRATLASEFAGAGLDQVFMTQFFGWKSFRSAESYINISSKRLQDELQKRGLI